MTAETYRSPLGGFEYSEGMIFAHTERVGVYARVDGFVPEQDAILFSVWEVDRPGWQGGAGFSAPGFAVMYHDGPYTQEVVDQATQDLGKSAEDALLDAILNGEVQDPEEAQALINNAYAEHRRILTAYLEGVCDAFPKSSPTRRGLKVAVHRLKEWKMSPAQTAPEGDQDST